MDQYSEPDLFTNHEGKVFDLNAMRRRILEDKYRNKIFREKNGDKVTESELWEYITLSLWETDKPNWGFGPITRDMESEPHLYSPWAALLSKLQASKDQPRVLLLTNDRFHNPNESPWMINERSIIEGLKKHSIIQPQWSFASETPGFWREFFGGPREDWIAQAKDVPSLILSGGVMRGHDGMYAVNTRIDYLVKKYAAHWRIPMESITLKKAY